MDRVWVRPAAKDEMERMKGNALSAVKRQTGTI